MKIKFAYIVWCVYLSAMQAELTKGDVYVVVDTPKKAKKLKKVLDMFEEKIYKSTNKRLSSGVVSEKYPTVILIDGDWAGYPSKSIIGRTKVSIKELRNILAKEHLRVGDYVVLRGDFKGKIISLFGNSEILVLDYENDKVTCSIEDFKRYATPEEIALLEPKQKELEVGKWYKYPTISNWMVCVSELNNSFIRGYGFNSKSGWMSDGKWMFFEDKLHLLVEATPQEVEEALVLEAKRRYKVVDKVNSLVSWNRVGNLDFKKVSYIHGINELWISSENANIKVFKNGKWAEVIKPEEIALLEPQRGLCSLCKSKLGIK